MRKIETQATSAARVLAGPWPGALLYAPPGSGKSEFVKAGGHRAKVVDVDDLVRSATGYPKGDWYESQDMRILVTAIMTTEALRSALTGAIVLGAFGLSFIPEGVRVAVALPSKAALTQNLTKRSREGDSSLLSRLDDIILDARETAAKRGWRVVENIEDAYASLDVANPAIVPLPATDVPVTVANDPAYAGFSFSKGDEVVHVMKEANEQPANAVARIVSRWAKAK